LSEPNEVIYKFTKKISGSSITPELPGKVSIEIDGDLDLEDLLEMFENFLGACGFCLAENEHVGIIREIEERDNESDTEI